MKGGEKMIMLNRDLSPSEQLSYILNIVFGVEANLNKNKVGAVRFNWIAAPYNSLGYRKFRGFGGVQMQVGLVGPRRWEVRRVIVKSEDFDGEQLRAKWGELEEKKPLKRLRIYSPKFKKEKK